MNRIKFLLIVFGVFVTILCRAQFADDFLDGDFLLNPSWRGDQPKFVVAGGRLKLQAPPTSGTAVLATPSQAVHEATWEFTMQLDFIPSSSNYAKIYLMSDQADLTMPLNGYFLKVGHTSREVSLFIQIGATETELIDGLDDRVNLPIVNLSVRIERSAAGVWQLYSDVGRTGIFTTEGATTDVTHTVSRYFGIQCFYTSTRSDKFWFDDFSVTGIVVPDTSPPKVLHVETIDSIRFRATFSEPLDSTSAIQTNYVLVEDLGFPESAFLREDQVTIEWTMPNPLTNGVVYHVQLSGIGDLHGNTMPLTTELLLYFRPGTPTKKDVLLTEVFPDPSPQLGLPAAEYVEVYNRSKEPFDLKDWRLSDGSSVALFPSTILLPGEYWVITTAAAVDLFQPPVNVIGLSNFPSLNNTGDVITLKDPKGTRIDSLNYSIAWYRDEDKAGGGWSLELIDIDNPCGEADNWTASENQRGGTPGNSNSVKAHKPDLTPPQIEALLPTGAARLSITFNETLMPASLPETSISIVPEVSIHGIFLRDVAQRTIEVDLSRDLQTRTKYQVDVRGIRDCNGNALGSSSMEFGLAEPADSLDVVISEVLFNPGFGGVDFVELFNASDKFIELGNWTISNEDSRKALPKKQLHPYAFLVLTTNPDVVESHYPHATHSNLVAMDLPSLPDDTGLILLSDDAGHSMEKLVYTREWHTEFLKSDEGVSLERIAVGAPTQEGNNWISASSVTGFATPGFMNSQQRLTGPVVQEVEIVPEIFSPGSASFDFVQIRYQFDQPGRMANVIILNRQGVAIRQISNNELLGSQGFLRWDGDLEDGAKAPAGYYIVWFETFQPDGQVSTFRKRVVISRR